MTLDIYELTKKLVTLDCSKVKTEIAGSTIFQYACRLENLYVNERTTTAVNGVTVNIHPATNLPTWQERDYFLLLPTDIKDSQFLVPVRVIEALNGKDPIEKGYYVINGRNEACKESATTLTFLALNASSEVNVMLPVKLNEIHLKRLRKWTSNMSGVSFNEESITVDHSWKSYYKLGWLFTAIRIAQGNFPKLTPGFIEKFENFIKGDYEATAITSTMTGPNNWLRLFNV